MDKQIWRACGLCGMLALATGFGLGLLEGNFLARRSKAEAERQLQSIDRDLLKMYVRFVQSDYGLPWELGPCETLSRAQMKAFERQTEWVEIHEGGVKRERPRSAAELMQIDQGCSARNSALNNAGDRTKIE